MKRNIKNIIMIVLVFVVVGCTVFTMYCASKSVSANNMGIPNGNEMNSSNQGTPPDKPESNGEDNQSSETNTNGEDKSDTNSENTNQNTPPEKPDDNGSNENTPPDKPEDNDNNQGTPPDMANNQNDMVNVSNDIETISETYMTDFSLSEDPLTSDITDINQNDNIPEEILNALKEMDNNSSKVIKSDTEYYLVHKGNIENHSDMLESNRESILTTMKSNEFSDMIQQSLESLDVKVNKRVIKKYQPSMFTKKSSSSK